MVNDNLRLVIVAQEFPYPPNHGGRADVWRRMRALQRLGCSVMLVCWCDDYDQPTAEHLRAVEQVAETVQVIVKRRGWRQDGRRLWRILNGIPSHAAARWADSADQGPLMRSVRAFQPQAVLLDSPYGGVFARQLSARLDVPLFYRSHNIEHAYFAGQAAAASSIKNRLAWTLARWHLHAYELSLMKVAAITFDISADDMKIWQAEGIRNGHWLPPLPEAIFDAAPAATTAVGAQLLFLGNLRAPNNVRGVRWLVEQVMPLVWQRRPDVPLTIAGSMPLAEVTALVDTDPRLELRANVADAPGLMAAAGLLLNPVLSGSGVNVKTLDMLMTERPIVSTPQGVAGLPQSLRSLCRVAADPQTFADQIIEGLEAPAIDAAARVRGREQFSLQAVSAAMAAMRRAIDAHRPIRTTA
ncbi:MULTISPECIES: glycosyltransferase [Duganella]|uniref:glycosyltransferase n=1 Tax=Duganella TaxID=75654 RepID=UPI0030E9D01E